MEVFWGVECYRGVLGSMVYISGMKTASATHPQLLKGCAWSLLLTRAAQYSYSSTAHTLCSHSHNTHPCGCHMSKQSSSQPINHFRAGGTQVLIFWIPAAVPTICSCLLGYLVNFILLWAAQTHTRIGVCCQETVSVGLLSPWQFGIKKKVQNLLLCSFSGFFYLFFHPYTFCVTIVCIGIMLIFVWLSVLLVVILVPIALFYEIRQLFSCVLNLIILLQFAEWKRMV